MAFAWRIIAICPTAAREIVPLLLTLAACLATALAMPSYIAVPADQIAFVDLTDLRLRRVPRQALTPQPHTPQSLIFDPQQYQPHLPQVLTSAQDLVSLGPQPVATQGQPLRYIQEPSGSATHGDAAQYAPERPADFGEFVDFGAHTGDNGAFGWYADYPVNNEGDSSSYK
ncbi:hypothetical protein EVAR_76458_1 [Eumeta japonica]|uniref:Uncharacterized protein n=1 Tax=Eumeta variegata TaxID=151549 RepID=A0A4C1T808_EUMVA|nr:hypothetical protein EVAR_76458_1 [Eumeta japonica]